MKYTSITFSILISIFAHAKSLVKSKTGAPNIVIILADDMGYSDLGCYGSEIPTPNLDKLASNGLKFTQFYNSGRCCPSRAALLTGLYPHEAGMGKMTASTGSVPEGAYQGYISKNTVTIAEVLRKNGYGTYMAGKWHVGDDSLSWPKQRGFDRYFGNIGGAGHYFRKWKESKYLNENTAVIAPDDTTQYFTNEITDYALSYLDDHQNKYGSEKPFFLYVAHKAPHWPLQALKEDIDKFRNTYVKGFEHFRDLRFQNQKRMNLGTALWPISPQDSAFSAWDQFAKKDDWALKMAVYAAMIYRLDQNVGRLVEKLKQQGKFDNTVIVFLSDNGGCHEEGFNHIWTNLDKNIPGWRDRPADDKDSYVGYGKPGANVSNVPFRLYKHWIHEGGISTPFIIHYPKMIKKPAQTSEIGYITDILPTFLDLAGVTYPKTFNDNKIKPMSGKSLVPILTTGKREGHEYICWEHFGNKGVRKGKWKLVFNNEGAKKWELYDMEKDRTELNDLSKNMPEKVKELEANYIVWAQKVGVNDPINK